MFIRSHRLVARTAILMLPLALATTCSKQNTTASGVSGPQTSATGGTTASSSSNAKRNDTTPPRKKVQSTASTEVADAPSACELITESDASEAFGEEAVAGDQRRDECWWSTANDLKTINVIRRTGDAEEWRSGYQNEHWEANDLGDEGFTGKALDSIVFRIGDTFYEINVVYSTKGDPRSVVSDLAEKVISRL